MFPGLNPFDGAVMGFVQQRMHSPFGDAFFLFWTYLGENGLIWAALGIALTVPKRTRRAGICVLAALAASFLCSEVFLKTLIQRPRPCDAYPAVPMLLPHPGGTSFPSSHAASSFAAATALFRFYKRAGAAALLAAALIAFSRVLLFVHYPTDVLAGAALGVLLGAAACAIVRGWAARSGAPGK